MTDALLDLSAQLEAIQNSLRALAQMPDVLRSQYHPITMAEAETLVHRLRVMVSFWQTRMRADERRHQERRGTRPDRRSGTLPELDGDELTA